MFTAWCEFPIQPNVIARLQVAKLVDIVIELIGPAHETVLDIANDFILGKLYCELPYLWEDLLIGVASNVCVPF